MKKWQVIIPLYCIFILTGCSGLDFLSKADPAESPENQIESLLDEADLNYEVPISVPNILVNEMGYLPDSKKIAVFRGENIPDTFRIVSAETGKVVFEGEVEDRGYNTYTDEYNSYGVFSEVRQSGKYYVEANVVGRSYFFTVGEGLYDSVFTDACKQYYYNRCGVTLTEEYAGSYAHSACHTQKVPMREDATVALDVSGGWHQDESGSKDIVKACDVMDTMLLAYELNGEVFKDDIDIPESGNQIPDLLDEIHYETDWLLKMQDAKTGGVYSGVTVYQPEGEQGNMTSYTAFVEPVSLEATAAYCATMANFGYIYQSYDTGYATECLKAADRAWRYLEKNYDDRVAELYFLAATEMYRAAGYQSYHSVITQYLNNSNYKEDMNETIMTGCITYLSTKMRVDKKLCSDIMKTIMLKAEEISADARQSQYLTAGNREQDNNGELLDNMFYLSVVNHIIKNHEYGTVIENHLHYFMGRNSMGISYIDGVGAKNYKDIDIKLGIMNQMESDSKFIFMLSEIGNSADALD